MRVVSGASGATPFSIGSGLETAVANAAAARSHVARWATGGARAEPPPPGGLPRAQPPAQPPPPPAIVGVVDARALERARQIAGDNGLVCAGRPDAKDFADAGACDCRDDVAEQFGLVLAQFER